jgi:hypothetical protein
MTEELVKFCHYCGKDLFYYDRRSQRYDEHTGKAYPTGGITAACPYAENLWDTRGIHTVNFVMTQTPPGAGFTPWPKDRWWPFALFMVVGIVVVIVLGPWMAGW